MIIKPMATNPILYRNSIHHFSIHFPRWWRKYTVVSRSVLYKGEVFISFKFRYRCKVFDPIFTMIISPFGKKEWRERYTDSPLIFLGEFNKHAYSYILPEELPNAFLKPDKTDYDYKKFGIPIHLLKKMVESVPIILKTLRFQ